MSAHAVTATAGRASLRENVEIFVQPLQTMHIYGAAGVAAFGWGLSKMLDFSCAKIIPLWFFGALLVYNLDRLKHDPADALNTPRRVRAHAKFHRASIVVAVISAAALVAFSAQDWRLLALTLCAGIVSLSYSFPLLGFRVKNLPVVKTLFAPGIVTLAYFVPPLLDGALKTNPILPALWTLTVLLFNMTLCDLRDIAGDRAHHVKSLPVLLGERGTRRLLLLMVALQLCLAVQQWPALAVISSICLSALLLALRKPRGEKFYEWFVEGILFLPAIVELGKQFAS